MSEFEEKCEYCNSELVKVSGFYECSDSDAGRVTIAGGIVTDDMSYICKIEADIRDEYEAELAEYALEYGNDEYEAAHYSYCKELGLTSKGMVAFELRKAKEQVIKRL